MTNTTILKFGAVEHAEGGDLPGWVAVEGRPTMQTAVQHTTADGKSSIKASDCRSCHLILAQGNGEQLQQVNFQGHNFFHIDSEYSDFSCTDCHTGGVQK
jgi:formate-dependent nitrite reductase cytochrome c552 subunit